MRRPAIGSSFLEVPGCWMQLRLPAHSDELRPAIGRSCTHCIVAEAGSAQLAWQCQKAMVSPAG